jgi:diadenosine tetraphosphatase ApaH/serine/threonine PP2A family protein phosphatase
LDFDLSHVIRESMEISFAGYESVIEGATRLLSGEKGTVGSFQVVGRLVEMKPLGAAVVVGDLHGDLESLVHILQESRIIQRMKESKSVHLIFLGDYGDRGNLSPEVIFTVLKLKLHFPAQIVLMRGNHESPKDLMAYPHDLPEQLQNKFGKDWTEAYDRIFRMFQYLCTSVLVEDRYLMVHGGLSDKIRTIDDLAYADTNHPRTEVLQDMLWSDPSETAEGVYPSPRGAGKLFGKDVTIRVLDAFKVHVLIRGHESCDEGFRIDHDEKVLTLFSRKGPPYFNSQAAYLDLELSEKIQDAKQLIPYIHRF